jgi:ribosomal protein S18 acetylase RimI-like enzyme
MAEWPYLYRDAEADSSKSGDEASFGTEPTDPINSSTVGNASPFQLGNAAAYMTTFESTSKINIRPVRREERAAAAEIAVAAFARLGSHLERSERAKLFGRVRETTTNPEPGQVIVAVAGARVVGSIVYNGPGPGQHPKFPAEWAFFRALGVDRAWAGKGIGRKLVEECIAWARCEGAAWIGLYAADVNDVAVGLYRRMGFKVIGDAFPHWGITYRIYGLDLSEG